ncbi:MAG: tRNA (guanosine(37)-N1)-methyltransferase TrmD [Candidatus Harrisonbacteria bacterium CG10_big_fil_rev_8_21_14_0_10_42_17]|uniref:tRNA (guanine-N(1)-)-methyltransferase n=1 Tax=Candidatus Harrisonbacteria bacterium CG10_big_fil_rev_8_21_14_0_10_42_17 TaxID=1974584 RepID=A0A2M6WGV3_9BACT|nr:MAG: tRNA (guanosine(37)-N1)-methyltransferase TrmD [Candidatus Harrisonbacteria bacterium CG10_big_fil_rev_8_21_14_0_10_42_17]
MKQFDILTIFPHILDSYINESILKRAVTKKLISIKTHDIREVTTNKHKTVDDTPYGGGPGMVLKVEPIAKSINKIKEKAKNKKTRIILTTPRGKLFNAKKAKQLTKYDQLIVICGRYEGVDERVAEYIADEEISIGDFILSGGELPAMVIIEAVARHIKGVLGKQESLEEVGGSHPVYTRPETVEVITKTASGTKRKKKWTVPKILTSGNHKEIKKWREEQGKKFDPPKKTL